jgi:isoleucyl-tRNA synthetase
MAPCVPFITEVMWKNLRLPSDRESVHLCDFPTADESLVDKSLSEDMAAVRDVITLGSSARNAARLNVRQPLAELVVSSSSNAARHAVTRFADLIIDELNVKAVRLHSGSAPLLTAAARLNRKTAASKLGPALREAEAELATMDAGDLAARLATGPVVIAGVPLERGDFVIEFAAQPGWCGNADKGTQVAINTTITEELRLEGLARDTVRQVQSARKDAKLDLLDKIALHLAATSPELAHAIATHRATIATAVQATQWSDSPLIGAGVHTATVKIDGQQLDITLRKV